MYSINFRDLKNLILKINHRSLNIILHIILLHQHCNVQRMDRYYT